MGLKNFGLEAVFSPPSDIMIHERKVSGNAQSRRRGVILHHGTLLVKTNLSLLTRILDAQQDGIMPKKVTSRKKPVTNLVDETGRSLTMNEVKESLRKGFERVFSVKLFKENLTLDEKKIAETLCREKYSRREWNFFFNTF
jgi:lipoate-protein ligase A